MTDLYVRRGETKNVRKRFTVLLLLVCALVVLTIVLRRGCAQRQAAQIDESDLPELLTVEGALEGVPIPSEPSTRKSEPSTPSTVAGQKSNETLNNTKPTRPAEVKSGPKAKSTPAAASTVGTQLRKATELQQQGALQEARELFYKVYEDTSDPEIRGMVMNKLGIVGIQLLSTPHPMPEKTEYTVQSGDSLDKLAKKFGTTIELVKESNNIRGSMIRIGDRLRIFAGTFSLSIDKSDNLLDLHLNDKFFKRYRVGTGEYNRTPVGDFKITDRIPQPTWWRPDGKSVPYGDPENELGTHWLSLDIRGYGIHGTWKPETIGHQASAGCIRLLNEEIEELYSILPIGTSVTITD